MNMPYGGTCAKHGKYVGAVCSGCALDTALAQRKLDDLKLSLTAASEFIRDVYSIVYGKPLEGDRCNLLMLAAEVRKGLDPTPGTILPAVIHQPGDLEIDKEGLMLALRNTLDMMVRLGSSRPMLLDVMQELIDEERRAPT